MSMTSPIIIQDKNAAARKILLRILATASFLVLFQAYLVAPLIPALAIDFKASASLVGLMVPAYTIPYGLSTLFYGPLSDRIGRKPVLLVLLGLMALATIALAFSSSAYMFLFIRVLMGLSTGGIVPIAIALLGDLYPYEERGRPIGLLYGAMAGGMTFGSTLGAYLNPLIGWRMEFIITGLMSCGVLLAAVYFRNLFSSSRMAEFIPIKSVFSISHQLLTSKKGRPLYSYIFLNGMFHSGIFAWLGYYFSTRYHLNDQGIGLALLGYGLPGMLLGVTIGKAADKYGRKKLIPIGLLTGVITVAVLVFKFPLWIAGASVALLSLGYDMTQPLFAGLVTTLGNNSSRGLAVGLSASMLFLGYGIGALVFQFLLHQGISFALVVFVGLESVLLLGSVHFFKNFN
jgi:predicted MFS family arabinose efflux permease